MNRAIRRRRQKRKHKRNPLKLINTPKLRNEVALAAMFHPGIKTHPNRIKKQNKEACRGRMREE